MSSLLLVAAMMDVTEKQKKRTKASKIHQDPGPAHQTPGFDDEDDLLGALERARRMNEFLKHHQETVFTGAPEGRLWWECNNPFGYTAHSPVEHANLSFLMMNVELAWQASRNKTLK